MTQSERRQWMGVTPHVISKNNIWDKTHDGDDDHGWTMKKIMMCEGTLLLKSI